MKVLAWHRTGSSYTCDPPTTNTDFDVLYYVDSLPKESSMNEIGWEKCAMKTDPLHYSKDEGFGVIWNAYRSGMLNVIYTTDKQFYLKFLAATLLAKHLNLPDKVERVRLHRFIKNGEKYDGTYKPEEVVK